MMVKFFKMNDASCEFEKYNIIVWRYVVMFQYIFSLIKSLNQNALTEEEKKIQKLGKHAITMKRKTTTENKLLSMM